MKKQIVLGLGLAVMATPALASKARLLALGEDANGSFYINDNRNIFLNASEVNNHKDLVTFEWGAAVPNASATGDADKPNAEGGLFRSMNNMVYGVQFGRSVALNDGIDDFTTAPSAPKADNAIDVFVGGDAGIKWGVQGTYASSKDETGANDDKVSVIDLAGGVTAGDVAGYVKYGIKNKSESAADEVEGKNNLEVGGSYKLNAYTIFGQYGMSKYELDAAIDDEVKSNYFQIGAGRANKLNDKATLFTKVAYVNEKEEADAANTEDKQWNLPATIGLEYDAASWLVLRASISQSLLSKIDKESATAQDGTLSETTTVAAGATLKFGELSVDGMIGNNDDGNVTGGQDNTSTGKGQLRTDSLMSRVAVSYRF